MSGGELNERIARMIAEELIPLPRPVDEPG